MTLQRRPNFMCFLNQRGSYGGGDRRRLQKAEPLLETPSLIRSPQLPGPSGTANGNSTSRLQGPGCHSPGTEGIIRPESWQPGMLGTRETRGCF